MAKKKESDITTLPDGRLQKVDRETGKVVWTQKANKAQMQRLSKARQVEICNKNYLRLTDKDGNVVWAHKDELVRMQDKDGKMVTVMAGSDPSKIPRKQWHFNGDTASIICSKITQGLTITKIVKEEGMPSRDVIYRWINEYPEFKEAINESRKIRAEVFADQMLETAEDVDEDGKFAIEKAKLKVKAYEWMAKKDNPERYDRKGEAKPQGPAKIYINTGIEDGSNKISINGESVDE